MPESNKPKWVIGSVAAGLCVVLLIVLAERGPAPQVQIVSVTREDLTASITGNGKVEPIAPTVARAEFPTFVAAVQATEGQSIRKGQLILTLDAADVRAQLSQARADLVAAQTDLRNARAGGPPDDVAQLQGDLQNAETKVANLERTQQALAQLVTKGAATQEEAAQNQAALATARANLQTFREKKAALEQRASVNVESAGLRVKQQQDLVQALEEKVRSATVIAPADGTLYSLPVHKGDFVKLGDVLAEMANLRHVRVRAFVDEPDLGALAQNEGVQVLWDAMPNRIWNGKVEQVPKQVVARGSRSVGEVLCSVDNNETELLPNVNVEVRVLVHEQHAVLVIPRGAVRYDEGQHFVLAYDGDAVHRRDIKVGVAGADKYEVLSGLALGDKVALPGEADLRDGMKVRAAEAK
ncbi:MAG: efflux RND transporter periplasmic adaptor subunit [Candidatus Acidiferrales bacterium]|jgi:HlyD family secretion protein